MCNVITGNTNINDASAVHIKDVSRPISTPRQASDVADEALGRQLSTALFELDSVVNRLTHENVKNNVAVTHNPASKQPHSMLRVQPEQLISLTSNHSSMLDSDNVGECDHDGLINGNDSSGSILDMIMIGLLAIGTVVAMSVGSILAIPLLVVSLHATYYVFVKGRHDYISHNDGLLRGLMLGASSLPLTRGMVLISSLLSISSVMLTSQSHPVSTLIGKNLITHPIKTILNYISEVIMEEWPLLLVVLISSVALRRDRTGSYRNNLWRFQRTKHSPSDRIEERRNNVEIKRLLA